MKITSVTIQSIA